MQWLWHSLLHGRMLLGGVLAWPGRGTRRQIVIDIDFEVKEVLVSLDV